MRLKGICIGMGTTQIEIADNLVHGGIASDRGQAQLRDNLAGHLDGYFVDPASGNLALTSAATGALGQGVPLADLPDDICRRPSTEHPESTQVHPNRGI